MNNMIEFLIIERCRNMGISIDECDSVKSKKRTIKINSKGSADKNPSEFNDGGQKCK
jgi:hypothetical protein